MNINCLSYIRMLLLKAKRSLIFPLKPPFLLGRHSRFVCFIRLPPSWGRTLSDLVKDTSSMSNTFQIRVGPLPPPQLLQLYWPGVSDLT